MLMNAAFDVEEWNDKLLEQDVITLTNGETGKDRKSVILVQNAYANKHSKLNPFPLGCVHGFEFITIFFNKELNEIYIDRDDDIDPHPTNDSDDKETWDEFEFEEGIDLAKETMYGAYVKDIKKDEIVKVIRYRWDEYTLKDPVKLVKIIK